MGVKNNDFAKEWRKKKLKDDPDWFKKLSAKGKVAARKSRGLYGRFKKCQKERWANMPRNTPESRKARYGFRNKAK